HSPELRDVQPTFIVSTSLNGRSGSESVFIRPANEVNLNANYFLPGIGGGDWKDAQSYSLNHTGGFARVRFPTAVENNCALLATNCEVDLVRDGLSLY